MAFKYSDMLETIKNRQWALADIDWDAPGAYAITDKQRPTVKQFMSDVLWIEHVRARAFAGMPPKAPFDALGDIYKYFHAEEQRHANAELALMKRWGMLDHGETLNRPGKCGGSLPWKRGWSHAEGKIAG